MTSTPDPLYEPVTSVIDIATGREAAKGRDSKKPNRRIDYSKDTSTPDLEYKHRDEQPNHSPFGTFNAYRNASEQRTAGEQHVITKIANTPHLASKAPQALKPAIEQAKADSTAAGREAIDSSDANNIYAVTEALFISSMLGPDCQYDPAAWGITPEMIMRYPKVHSFCMRYQAKAGNAPPPMIVHQKHPGFYYTEGIDTGFAAELLINEYKTHLLRDGIHKALTELMQDGNNDANPDIASKHLTDAVKKTSSVVVSEAVAYESIIPPDPMSTIRIPLDYPGEKSPLMELTNNGIGSGELWLLAARFGVGKTYRLINSCVAAAEAGNVVHLYSMEMTVEQVRERMDRIALRNIPCDFGDPKDVDRARAVWKQSHNGKILIHDPSKGTPSAARISGQVDPGELVVLDYIGKMRSSTGRRAKEDFREMALIAQELKELALTAKVPILSAAQINREGVRDEEGGQAHHLAQSDDLGQEADVIHVVASYAQKVHMNTLSKNRYGPQKRRWFTEFDPDRNRFGYISADEAERLKEASRDERQM